MLCGEQTSLIDILIDSLMICFKWSHPRYTSCLALPRAAVINWSKEHSLPTILIDVSVIFQEKMQRICGFQLLNVKIYSCFFVIQSLAFGLMTTWWALFKLFFFSNLFYWTIHLLIMKKSADYSRIKWIISWSPCSNFINVFT